MNSFAIVKGIGQDADAEIKRKKRLGYAQFYFGHTSQEARNWNTDFAKRPLGPLATLLLDWNAPGTPFFLNGLRFGVLYSYATGKVLKETMVHVVFVEL